MMGSNMKNPKVSVVIPVYKVEKYLQRCVDSILDQTYENLEIILVDDGSPDKCGEVIDQYERQDQRIKALHKKNGGLSDARNYGMEQVTGDYVVFVDSDDWIDQRMIEIMVKNSQEYEADIVQTAFYYTYDNYLLFDNHGYTKPRILDRQSLMRELVINEKVKNFAWGKLYRTQLIKDIPFKEGVLFEDVFWAHLVMHRVETYVIINQPLYYYLQRSDSIVSTYTPRNLDMIQGLKERHLFIRKNYENLIDHSFKALLQACLTHYNLLASNDDIDHDGQYRKDIQVFINGNYNALKKAVQKDGYLRKQLFLFHLHPYLNRLFLFVEKVLRKLKVISQPRMLERVDLNEGGV